MSWWKGGEGEFGEEAGEEGTAPDAVEWPRSKGEAGFGTEAESDMSSVVVVVVAAAAEAERAAGGKRPQDEAAMDGSCLQKDFGRKGYEFMMKTAD